MDFDLITRKGYGKNVLQREGTVLNTLDAARRATLVDSRPASGILMGSLTRPVNPK